MAKLIDMVRITASQTAVWRICRGCGLLAALPPEVEVCPDCQPATEVGRHQPRGEERR